MNNQVLDELSKLQTIYHDTQKDIHRLNLEQSYNIATMYGEGLKEIHCEVMSRITNCLESVDNNLADLEKTEQITKLRKILRILAFVK